MLTQLLAEIKDRSTNYWSGRILSQLEYADKLSMVKEGKYDQLINSVCSFIKERYGADGTITSKTALEAESMLKEMAEEAKKYKMLCAAHAHIDMNWMWSYDETVSITIETFRTMLDLMNEYPDFKFSQSQASVYKIVETHDPEMLEEIKMRVKEGRWEVTASTWVENDKNIPNGESLSRHILYTKKYLSELLDIEPDRLNIDFEPDTFGHSVNVPEVLTKGNVKYYYHCRGYDGHVVYRWVAPSGASVIVYREPLWYNGHIDPSMVMYIPEFCTSNGIDVMMKVYGVGDHGGGPTRRDIERIMDMDTWPVFPQIKFGTFGEFFSVLEANSSKLPVVEGELNFVFDGCYTSQSRIKKGNRRSEVMLNEAELFNSMSSLNFGTKYPAESFNKAWQDVLFNHFHDIIPGSGVVDTREHAMGLYQEALAVANSSRTDAFRKISRNIDTSKLIVKEEVIKETVSEGAGVGFDVAKGKISQTGRGSGKTRIFHFFNPSVHDREEVTELIVWDWDGDIQRISFKDSEGETTLHQVVSKGFNHYWGHSYIKLLVNVKVPACGYSTYVMTETQDRVALSFPRDPRVQRPYENVMENEKIRVTFDTRNAIITSIIDKASGEELIDASRKGCMFRLIEEEAGRSGTAWVVGRYMNITPLDRDVTVKKADCLKGSLRQSICYEVQFMNSKMEVEVWLDKDSSFVNYRVKCDWRELGVPGKVVQQLSFYIPTGFKGESYRYDVPFGAIDRNGMNIDVPANSWAACRRSDSGKKTLMLVTDSKNGFRCVDQSASVTLIRSTFDPDPYPEVGLHEFAFAIGVVDNSASNRELIDLAYDYNHPFSVLSGKAHDGHMSLCGSFISLQEGSIAVSAVKKPEAASDNSVVVRVYETDGIRGKAVLSFAQKPVKAYFVDINEVRIDNEELSVTIEGNKITFDMAPYSVANLVVEF